MARVPPAGDGLDRDRLLQVLDAVAEGPGLARLLPAVVALLEDAAGGDACLICLRDDDRLTVRAASPAFAESVDRIAFGLHEGTAGHVVRRDEAVVVGGDADADERPPVVPGLRESRFASTAAVPLRGRTGLVIGVLVVHAEAPRAFGPQALVLLEQVAALVGGPVENARLHDGELRRVVALDRLAALVRRIATVPGRGELGAAACDGTVELLGADRCRLHLVDLADGATRVVAQAGTAAGAARP
ncbi:GAF domain-containing protein, partial [Patulibacter sp.]|uniref:GAF domain-containing protein n=1 Tax=Patulibacter sp. TaxID=1912859 RepID=UPI0027283A23